MAPTWSRAPPAPRGPLAEHLRQRVGPVAPTWPPTFAPTPRVGRLEPAKAVEEEALPPPRKVVLFWGICDVKYDPRLPEGQRVRVLELGDGKASRFSHHGAALREKFEDEYCFDHCPIKRELLVENKRITHDRFVNEGFGHLRPRTVCYPRRYELGLAGQILADLTTATGTPSAVVLKLCNRCRGAGVVVAPSACLDDVLQRLLVPPEVGSGMDAVIAKSKVVSMAGERTERRGFEEQCLHWWSNECPVFIAEECCSSVPVEGEDPPGYGVDHGMAEERPAAMFNGTMRVAFALRDAQSALDSLPSEPQGREGSEGEGTNGKPSRDSSDWQLDQAAREPKERFVVEWLGGYWKLPQASVSSDDCRYTRGAGDDFEQCLVEVRARVVSSFGSAEKRTAAVAPAHLAEVYAALTPALPRVFQAGPLGVQTLMSDYKKEPLLCSFALARTAAGMRASRMSKAEGLLDIARGLVPGSKSIQVGSPHMLPERAVLSYIDRNSGVCRLMQKRMDHAAASLNEALRLLPTSASAHYTKGRYHEERGAWEEAADCQARAMALDPDFKLPYIALANCLLKLGRFEEAAAASRAGLTRHPDSALARFTLGQAVYHGVRTTPDGWPSSQDGAEDPREEACEALKFAQRRSRLFWQPTDDRMLAYLQLDRDIRDELPKEPVHIWKLQGWRP